MAGHGLAPEALVRRYRRHEHPRLDAILRSPDPVRFPPDRNPFRIIAHSIGRMEGVPPCVDLRSAARVGEVDYVLVSGATRENALAIAL